MALRGGDALAMNERHIGRILASESRMASSPMAHWFAA